ncbi:MAG TPA: ABC transporter substrate-binding protein, partial [Spirochaetia bacterium]|nr:ABC transporter substrate-binding protein [Spirochaetia bacterium]
MKRAITILLVFCFLTPLLFAEGGKEGAASERSQTIYVDILSGRNPNAGNYNIWVPGAGAPSTGIQQLMVRPLWMADPGAGTVLNVLAKDPPVYNADFTQMTANLRDGIFWSDGTEFTADDVVYTVETLMKNKGMTNSSELNLYVKNVRKSDKYQVVFDLKSPNSRFHTYFLDRWGGVRFFPKHVWEKVADPMTYTNYPPVSLGPYVLEDYDPNGYWFKWKRRADWQRTVTGKLYGMPQPLYVVFYYYGTPDKKVLAQAQHQLDMADLTPEALRAVFEKNPASRGFRKEFPWVVNVDPCITGIMLNVDKPPFNLKDVRWALALATDIVDADMIGFDGTATVGAMLVPPNPVYLNWYYKPMESWLENLTLDINVNGQPFKPYDTEVPMRLAAKAKERGYTVPTDPAQIRQIWGYGWWKYAPDVAAQLLERNGFKRTADGKWLLPDGTPWKFSILTTPNQTHPQSRNGFMMSQQWKKFGIDVSVETNDQYGAITQRGMFDAGTTWPAREPWGAHPDMFRTFENWYSKYYKPIGEMAIAGPGASSRWHNPAMDKVVDQLRETAWANTDKIIQLGIEGLKVATVDMAGIPTVAYPGIVGWDTEYWTNYPGAED